MELMQRQIRVLLVEDETIVGEAILALLGMEPWITLVGEAENAETAVRKVRLLKPDVVLLDLHLPDRSGVEVIEEIMRELPQTRILVLTGSVNENEVYAAFRAGAIGYVLKTQAINELTQAIDYAVRGYSAIHPKVANIMLNKLGQSAAGGRPLADRPLSEAEMRVLVLVAQGLANKEIARQLGVSRMTVHVHVSNILAKLGIENRTQAALYALKKGWVTLDSGGNSSMGKSNAPLHCANHALVA